MLRKLSVFGLETAAPGEVDMASEEVALPMQGAGRGHHLRIQCCKDPLRSEVCKWECTFEETVEGWVLE